jgi:hypothetical protein
LFHNKNVFAWSENDLCGVNRSIIEQALNVDPSTRPRKHKVRKMSEDKAEVKRFLSAGVIREVAYLEWLVLELANTWSTEPEQWKIWKRFDAWLHRVLEQ